MKTILEIFQAFSVILVSIVAVYGISSWRKEAKWKRKYELAEEVLSTFYEVYDKFDIIRNPASSRDEGKSRRRNEKESEEESEILDNAYVVIERWEKEKVSFNKLKSLKYRFIAINNVKGASEPFDEIVKLTNKLLFASYKLGNRYWKDQGRRKFTDKQFEKHIAEMHECEDIFWANHGGEDKFKEELDQTISKIEKICHLIIGKK